MASAVRSQVAWLGVTLEAGAHAVASGAARISAADSQVSVWVIPTDKDRMIVRQVWRLGDGGR